MRCARTITKSKTYSENRKKRTIRNVQTRTKTQLKTYEYLPISDRLKTTFQKTNIITCSNTFKKIMPLRQTKISCIKNTTRAFTKLHLLY